ncbi:hypothetical protein MMC30_007271 [Trapelia coarctata]|nr:hypothetical protein [Trapelia coarctata]
MPFVSPKRKRDTSEDHTANLLPYAIRLRTDLPSRPIEDPFAGSYSPRAAVAGQLQVLHIQEEYAPEQVSYIPRRKKATSSSSTNPHIQTAFGMFDTSSTSNNVASAATIITPSTPPKIPSTPHLKPVSPSPARTISPLPRRKLSPPLSSSPRSRSPPTPTFFHGSRSPSPSDTIDIQNLGLNGIGYKPTPAMAYARSQRRKQQVADWKAREAKEARQRRIESRRQRGASRRKGLFDPGLFDDINEMNAGIGMETEPATRRVRFVEG